jgi:16S rRNA (guanine527-N7)-methyltransferase
MTLYLHEGLEALGLSLSALQLEQLEHYLALLQKWNKVYNLTAIQQPKAMVDKHILDSLSIFHLIRGTTHLDVGTGAGLPGIPLAIANPAWSFTLLDSSIKKTRFLTQVKAELTLDNLSVVHQRLQEYRPAHGFDMIVSRAFKSVVDMVEICSHLDYEQLLVMKGQHPPEGDLPEQYAPRVVALSVPHLAQARHAVMIKRVVA